LNQIEAYYNKFNEEKRLNSRHGRVEYVTSMKYIHEGLSEVSGGRDQGEIRILDVGAGTGRYSIPLSEEGYDVTAVELVRHNLGILKAKGSAVKAFEGNALKLKRFSDESFDAVILFGPMYHLHSAEDKLAALLEAKRVVRGGGLIFAAYIMNEYSVITYAFKERHILEAKEQGMLDDSFHTQRNANELYSFVRLEDIENLNFRAGLTRKKIIAADGAANYMRPFLNALTEEEFEQFVQYHLATCERGDLLGASAHTVDILTK
jgi:SAM-dependent methyltransferase